MFTFEGVSGTAVILAVYLANPTQFIQATKPLLEHHTDGDA